MAADTPRRLLVATDLSDRAGPALRRAVQLSGEVDASLTALHVVPARLSATPGVDLAEIARACLATHLHQHIGTTPVATVVRRGRVVCEIVAEAAERGADLLVVGAHGEHWLGGPALGSTPENLVRAAEVPVLVVRGPVDGAYRRVVLGFDPSPLAAEAAHLACALSPNAEHLVVHLDAVIGETLLRLHGTSEEDLAQLRRVSTERVRGLVERLAGELDPAPSRVLIGSGRPQARLAPLSRRLGADLVALGTGDRSALGYALLGSVAQHVLREATADVLVVPATGEG
ncbi:universal stress protein [Actinomycetospora cinnamomea]|uniref:Nucleotide-binding universal stress UspA family protein n=1 Tax=Actinomycetospora cinnamomea TaxID=663609 RepID=A0A2U1F2Q1_9PSEU|nr:universal stress protein [Actinomycetospora cinnamomea]PVZ06409.1 nucleotide-binding universal stress UspA family protein [Actinomycetospora cinnamomea]